LLFVQILVYLLTLLLTLLFILLLTLLFILLFSLLFIQILIYLFTLLFIRLLIYQSIWLTIDLSTLKLIIRLHLLRLVILLETLHYIHFDNTSSQPITMKSVAPLPLPFNNSDDFSADSPEQRLNLFNRFSIIDFLQLLLFGNT